VLQREKVATATTQDGADCLRISLLTGAHRTTFPRIIAWLREQAAGNE